MDNRYTISRKHNKKFRANQQVYGAVYPTQITNTMNPFIDTSLMKIVSRTAQANMTPLPDRKKCQACKEYTNPRIINAI